MEREYVGIFCRMCGFLYATRQLSDVDCDCHGSDSIDAYRDPETGELVDDAGDRLR